MHPPLYPELFTLWCQVLDLMGREAEAMGKMTCQRKQARWVRILEAVRLSPSQQQTLLQLRQQHLNKLHDVYSARQSLNMHVRLQTLSFHTPQPDPKALCPRRPRSRSSASCKFNVHVRR